MGPGSRSENEKNTLACSLSNTPKHTVSHICRSIDPQDHPNVSIYGSPISRVWDSNVGSSGLCFFCWSDTFSNSGGDVSRWCRRRLERRSSPNGSCGKELHPALNSWLKFQRLLPCHQQEKENLNMYVIEIGLVPSTWSSHTATVHEFQGLQTTKLLRHKDLMRLNKCPAQDAGQGGSASVRSCPQHPKW